MEQTHYRGKKTYNTDERLANHPIVEQTHRTEGHTDPIVEQTRPHRMAAHSIIEHAYHTGWQTYLILENRLTT